MSERFPSLEADDIIQETLVALCRVLPSYRYAPDEKWRFHNYLTGILRNKALRMLRNEERQREIAGRAVSTKPPPCGRAVAPRPQPSDSLAELCAAHAPVSANGHFPSGTIFGDWRLTALIKFSA